MTIALTPAQENKVKKLADEAGLTVRQMWNQVLKHGLPAIEDYFKGIRQAEADIEAGRTYTTEQVFSGGKRKKGGLSGQQRPEPTSSASGNTGISTTARTRRPAYWNVSKKVQLGCGHSRCVANRPSMTHSAAIL